jgi:pyrimidine deaminase RibD-like protein
MVISLETLKRKAQCSRHKQHHHVAVLTRGGAVVAIGYNHEETHAEAMALGKVWPNRRRGLVLWSFRLTKAGKLAMAMPCPKCQEMLIEAGVKTVRYSDSDGSIKTMKLR